MILDKTIRDAIQQAATEAKQGEELTRRLLALVEGLMEGNVDIGDKETRTRYLELLYEATAPMYDPDAREE